MSDSPTEAHRVRLEQTFTRAQLDHARGHAHARLVQIERDRIWKEADALAEVARCAKEELHQFYLTRGVEAF